MTEKHQLLTNALTQTEVHEKAINQFNENYGDLETVEMHCAEIMAEQKVLNDKIATLNQLERSWLDYKLNNLKWLLLFSWLPPVRRRLRDKIKLFFLKQNTTLPDIAEQLHNPEFAISKNFDGYRLDQQTLKEELEKLTAVKAQHQQLEKTHQALKEQLGFDFTDNDLVDYTATDNLHAKLDMTLRYELFFLAVHYWEARWLLESSQASSLGYSRAERKTYWSIQAMLTPCLVTTLHSGPRFFSYLGASKEFETAEDFIDLLIVDEAGQTMAAVAGAMVSTAKKALFVGDSKQIEPIFKLTESIDLANAKKFHLCDDAEGYDALQEAGILCSGDQLTMHAYSNLVLLGQRAAKYHLNNNAVPGMLLTEHRRCAKEIISYCNELCYDNQLIPLT
ncbi:MAG: hypothetical protein GY821_13435 [Gammaproteobacteria bacterium]|nr:hypothetical protein [Gammaproteobacteria bacterium]